MTTSISAIKKSIRDTERLLSRQTLPADVHRDQERKLALLRHQAAAATAANRQRALSGRYRAVRFVEAKKAARRLAQALKSGDAGEIEESRKDALYVQFFPADQRYVSLWPSLPMDDADQLAKRAAMRERIFEEHSDAAISVPGVNMAAAAASSSSAKRKAAEQSEEDGSEEEDDDDNGSGSSDLDDGDDEDEDDDDDGSDGSDDDDEEEDDDESDEKSDESNSDDDDLSEDESDDDDDDDDDDSGSYYGSDSDSDFDDGGESDQDSSEGSGGGSGSPKRRG